MRPYGIVLFNLIRNSYLRLCGHRYTFGKVEMLSLNTKIVLGKNAVFNLGNKVISDGRFTIICDQNAQLSIGNNVYFNEGNMISCKSAVNIGDGCKFGPGVMIFDNNHKFDPINGVSNAHTSAPITIGEGSWIGANVVILKGANIGKSCVIGAGCIVSGDIPDCSIAEQDRHLIIKKMEVRE